MWSDGDPRRELNGHEVVMGRPGSDAVVLDERVIEAASRAQPGVTKIHVTKSSRLHIGPKFVSVTQNVDNTEVVKDLPLPRYLWDIAKNTTKAERLSCAAAIVVLLICIILIVYFTVIAKKTVDQAGDVAPHEWYITRNMWLAPPFLNDDYVTSFAPLKLVIIAHTVSAECHLFKNCAAELRTLQSYFNEKLKYDLPYNFLIGNEGRVYEGRGWNKIGAHTKGYNNCSLGLAFIGDYREGLPSYSKVTELQLKRAKMLFDKGVELGYLHKDYHVVGAKDVQSSLSPGTNLYRAIQQWPTYSHDQNYTGKTCEEIYASLNRETVAAETTTLLSTSDFPTSNQTDSREPDT